MKADTRADGDPTTLLDRPYGASGIVLEASLQDLGRAIAPPHDPAVRIRLCPLVEERPSSILLNDVVRLADRDSIALLEQENAIAESLHAREVVADEDDSSSLALQAPEDVEALLLEADIADGENLVDEIDVGVSLDRRGKAEPHMHSRGVVLELQVHEILELGELDDRREATASLRRRKTEKSRVDDDVVESGKLGVESDPELDEG